MSKKRKQVTTEEFINTEKKEFIPIKTIEEQDSISVSVEYTHNDESEQLFIEQLDSFTEHIPDTEEEPKHIFFTWRSDDKHRVKCMEIAKYINSIDDYSIFIKNIDNHSLEYKARELGVDKS